jgi:hypothetical protein
MASKQGERYSPIVAPLLRTDRHTPRRPACPTDRHPPPPARSPAPAWHARDDPVVPRRGSGGGLPPGLAAACSPGGLVVQLGRDARRSSANVRHSAAAQVQAVKSFVLDGLPGTTPAGHSSWLVVERAFGACCFAGKLRSPAPPTGEPRAPGRWLPATPTAMGTSTPTSFPTPWGCVPLRSMIRVICPARPPSGEWSGRAARSASRD